MAEMSRWWIVMVTALFAATGCGGSGESEKTATRMTVGVAYTTAGKRDASYSQAAALGIEVAKKKMALDVREIEPGQLSDLEATLRSLSQAKPKLVVAVSFFYTEPLKRVAPQFPDVKYVIIDGEVSGFSNVKSVLFRAEEGSFLVGALAAMKSQTKKIGAVIALNIPIMNEFLAGFHCGARVADPSVAVLHTYIGSGPESFNDPLKGQEKARELIRQRADVIYQVAGASGWGVIKAAKEAQGQVWAIGVDSNQNGLAPGTVLTSMLKRVDLAVESSIQEAAANTFKASVDRLGLEQTGRDFVDYAVDSNNEAQLTDEMKRRVEALRSDVRLRRIVVPKVPGAVEANCRQRAA